MTLSNQKTAISNRSKRVAPVKGDDINDSSIPDIVTVIRGYAIEARYCRHH